MALAKRYNPSEVEPRLLRRWDRLGIYKFEAKMPGNVFSIDTPPPTISGHLHLGHVYSYSHPDFMARYWRMKGFRVFYPMGFDDNGLPTERLVENRLGVRAQEIGRAQFITECLKASEEAQKEYQEVWKRLGLSIDWRYTYRTIEERARRISQQSFIDLYKKGLAYRHKAPVTWCPECRTAIAQAELEDLQRESEFVSLAFRLENGSVFPIATTRPELLPACVAVFVHPNDERYHNVVGKKVEVPIFGQKVPVMEDKDADPSKGSGAVMCCTFGDRSDVNWWYRYQLPLIEVLDRYGLMTEVAREYAGLPSLVARDKIKETLEEQGLISKRQKTHQSVRVHERCDTPVEYIVTWQWFIKILDYKAEIKAAGERVNWHPAQMHARYGTWLDNLSWDWCVSRQRYFGVPFPLWYCEDCDQVALAEESQLPVDPHETAHQHACQCGSQTFRADPDVMDTWATSSMTPQIVGQWPNGEDDETGLFKQVFPFSLRPQAHEIIRTWAFYTLVKSQYHFGHIPWENVLISGWGIAGEGMGKISKKHGGGPIPPLEMIERYSADAVRYWAASTGPGKDAVISENKIMLGSKLINKLWNVARFSVHFFEDYNPTQSPNPILSPADKWITASTQALIRRVSALLDEYEYAAAKSELENFFWHDLADNYLEMCKQRLYDIDMHDREGAKCTLHRVLLTTLKLFAPYMPYVTEEIYLGIFNPTGNKNCSIHTSEWPKVEAALEDKRAIDVGEILVNVATTIRRYKSEHNLPLGYEIQKLQLKLDEAENEADILKARSDLSSITRARHVEVVQKFNEGLMILKPDNRFQAAIEITC